MARRVTAVVGRSRLSETRSPILQRPAEGHDAALLPVGAPFDIEAQDVGADVVGVQGRCSR